MTTALLYFIVACALIALAHRFVMPLSRGAAIVLVILPLCFTGWALLTGRIYGPVEMPYVTQPLWGHRQELHVGPPQNPMLSDVAYQLIPWREALRRGVADREWPLLNRFESCGDVLAAAAQAAPFSPFTLLALLLPTAQSFTFTAAIAFFLAGLGAFLLARDLGCRDPASFVCAMAFMFSAPIALQILWPLGFAWTLLPLVLLGTRRVVREPSIRSIALLTTALTFEALAGHPETLLHVVAVGVAYGAFELLQRRTRLGPAIAAAAAAGILALLLSAIALLPFLEAAPQTIEHHIRNDFFARAPLRVSSGFTIAALLSDLLPFARASFRLFLMQRAEAGSIVLALAIFAIVPWRRAADDEKPAGLYGASFFVALAAVCLLASANAWPVAQLLHRLPLLNIALNDRLASAVPLCLGVLAAFGIERLSDRAGAVMVALLIVLAAGTSGMRPGTIDIPRFAAETVPLALAAIAMLIRFPPLRSGVRPQVLVLMTLILMQRTISDGRLIPVNPASVAYPPLVLFEPLRKIREPFRIVATGASLFPNTATMYGLEDVRGLTAMTLTPFVDTYPLWCRYGGWGFNQVDDLTRPMLSMLNVRFAITQTDEAIPPGWREVTTDHGSRLLENEHALPRAFVPRTVRLGSPPGADIEEMKLAADFADRGWLEVPDVPHDRANGPGVVSIKPRNGGFDLDATMDRDGFVVISETAWIGWRAYLDGHRVTVLRANHAFLGVFVPAGHHTVRLVYEPRSFLVGRAITLTTLALLAAAAFVAIMRRR